MHSSLAWAVAVFGPLSWMSCVAPLEAVEARGVEGAGNEQRFFDWSRLPFSAASFEQRRARLSALLREAGGGVYLAPSRAGRSDGGTFRQLDDFLYFSGLEVPDSVLAVEADSGRTVLFAPRRDTRFESASRPNDFPGRPLADDPELARRSGIADVRPIEGLDSALAAWARDGGVFHVALPRVDDSVPARDGGDRPLARSPAEVLVRRLVRDHPAARVRNGRREVARLRMVKSREEVDAIRRACAVTCEGIRAAAAEVRPGVDERGLEAALEAAFKRGGAQRLAFDSIIKSGPNSLWPWRILAAHYDRRNRKLRAGELVIFDVGCELDYYASDVGRTFPVSGRFDGEQRRALELSTSVADAIIAAIRPGVTFADLRAVADARIPEPERAYMQAALFFGHHIGLDVGDPSLPDVPLEAGMVFTVEPWYYNHDRGLAVFVEDVVLVTEDGVLNLTRALARSPEELERMVPGGGGAK